ncbi:UNVERIFIED_CONTAM: Lipid phosphate phosphatase gamma [Sesamum angustifolium]|uniref:Lipid phosphate phosphatase gamma n=1 Tax=Sesamum angustifolium TaxID=2727405 RepID=A0AAW2MNY7_9LAMI
MGFSCPGIHQPRWLLFTLHLPSRASRHVLRARAFDLAIHKRDHQDIRSAGPARDLRLAGDVRFPRLALEPFPMWIVGLVVWPLAVLTLYSRVYLGYHTVAQVFAGAALGAVLGGGWFWVVNNLLRCHFPAIEESAFGRMFYVKDTSHIPNVLKFEYENARAARKHVSYKRSD